MFLRIALDNHPEAAKLAVITVEMPVMVGVPCNEATARKPIIGLGALDNVNRKWKSRTPRSAGSTVLEIEAGRRRVPHSGFRTEVVPHRDHEVRLFPAHQVYVTERRDTFAGKRTGPRKTGRSTPEEIHNLYRTQLIRRGKNR
jgi:hypothetical protein